MKTISRRATRKISALATTHTACSVFSLDNGFTGVDVPVSYAWKALETYDFARLRDHEDGRLTVQVHGNLWYQLTRP